MENPNSLHVVGDLEVSFPVMMMATPPKRSPTKINIIVLSIPLIDARVINLILLTLGTGLNFLIILAIVCKPSFRTSTNLYVVSLACSNMVILVEPLEEILKWFFDVNLRLNMDYVCMISFDVAVITIAILKFMLYVGMFQEQTIFAHTVLKMSTAVKGILLTWSSCIVTLAIGLHIYDFFEGDMADIYVWFTFMFIVMPLIICVALGSLIVYELTILKAIEGSWRTKESRHLFMLAVVLIAFFLIRAPYRVARAISFIKPKALCCTDSKREVLYFMAKTYPTVFSVIYISLSNEFYEIFRVILKRLCQKSHKGANDDTVI